MSDHVLARVGDAAVGEPSDVRAGPRPGRLLALLDGVGVVLSIVAMVAVDVGLAGRALGREHLVSAVLVGASAAPVMMALKLHVRAANRIASAEMTRVARAGTILATVVLGAYAVLGLPSGLVPALTLGTSLFLTISAGRQVFRDHVQHQRRAGQLAYRTVVVGNGPPAIRMVEMLLTHPALGFEPAGLVTTDRDRPLDVEDDLTLPHLGTLTGDPAEMRHLPEVANGAIVVASTLDGAELDGVVHRLLDVGMHVHVVQGLTGIASQRMFSDPLLTDAAFYVAPEPPAGLRPLFKRLGDVVLGGLAMVLLAPVMLAVALAVRFDSAGPVLFRQERVGRDSVPFTLLKFRTMVMGAEQLVVDLEDDNHRDGPLFKVPSDPRVTRVGRFLRRTSLDELPQLLNVLRGEMSLVGPRPALPSEVAVFDDELLERQTVRPGITGLWQVEARDDSSFDLYRRYDLFYVRNWSMLLDLVILFRTAISVLLRPLAEAARSRTADDSTVLD